MRLDEYKTTNNNQLYKRLRKRYLENQNLISCSYCRYHRLENRNKKGWTGDRMWQVMWYPVISNKTTWKKVRRHQYKCSKRLVIWKEDQFSI